MDRLKVLVTGSGAPGIKGTIYSLKNNYDGRVIDIIGTDSNEEVIGKYLCDKFFKISPANDIDKYLNDLNNIVKTEKINIILPQNTLELNILAKNIDYFSRLSTKVVISNLQSINVANNKYLLMKRCKELGIPVGKFFLVNNKDDLINSANALDWPKKRIVIKPPVSNGSRGVRIIDEMIDLKNSFYNNKPTSINTNMDSISNILGESFPDLIVSEYHSGQEYTVDVFNYNKIIVIPRKRLSIRSGITFNGIVEKNLELINKSIQLTKSLKLDYCFGYQFIYDNNDVPKLIECNPRVQGTMVMSTFAGANIIYSSIKAVLGEEIPNFQINWGTKFYRYWGGLSLYNNHKIKTL